LLLCILRLLIFRFFPLLRRFFLFVLPAEEPFLLFLFFGFYILLLPRIFVDEVEFFFCGSLRSRRFFIRFVFLLFPEQILKESTLAFRFLASALRLFVACILQDPRLSYIRKYKIFTEVPHVVILLDIKRYVYNGVTRRFGNISSRTFIVNEAVRHIVFQYPHFLVFGDHIYAVLGRCNLLLRNIFNV